MAIRAEQAAVVGVGIASVIAISSAEGPYTFFDGVLGVVLLILLAYFYDRGETAGSRPLRTHVPLAAVLALVLCVVISPLVQWILWWVAPNWRDQVVDAILGLTWIGLFAISLSGRGRASAERLLVRLGGTTPAAADQPDS